MDTPDIIRTSLGQAMQALQDFLSSPATYESIRLAAEAMAFCLGNGGKVLACGNGGSMCDATHFAEELTGRYRRMRRPLAAVSINDPAYISCTGNDFGFDEVFSRYVLGVGAEGDVLLAISTSGKSPNILNAVRAAHEKGMAVVALTSEGSPNPLADMADVCVCAPAMPYADRIQEIHIKVIHVLVECIEHLLQG